MRLGERIERGEVDECAALPLLPGREASRLRSRAKDQLERLRLERENRIVVDESLAVERAGLSLERRELRGHVLGAIDLLDP